MIQLSPDDADAHTTDLGKCRLSLLEDWARTESDLSNAQSLGFDIVSEFCGPFQQRSGLRAEIQGQIAGRPRPATLDVRKLEWPLEEAQIDLSRDFSDRKFQSFHRCAVDPARIELDRLVRDMQGLDEARLATVARLEAS